MAIKDLRGKRLLVMGGMRISCEIIHKAKTMGIVVGVADYNTIDNSPGKQIADEHYEVNITDVDAVVSLINEKNFDGVIVGFNDMLLPYYAEICAKAGLPCYGTKEQFDTFTNKDRFKTLCRKYDIPTIIDYDINDTKIEFPVLVKPVDNSGSRGITICHNRKDLIHAYNNAIENSKVGRAIIERYIDGREVSIFWVFKDGDYFLTAMGNRHIKNNQSADVIPLPVGYTFPSVYLEDYQENIEPKCKSMFSDIGIKDGMMFMQCKVANNICYIYDIGYRLTGSLEYYILEQICDYNPLEMIIRFSLTGTMGEPDLIKKVNPNFKTPAFNVSCLSSPGTIDRIDGIENLPSIKDVKKTYISHMPGDTITPQMTGLLSQIAIRVLGTVESIHDLYPIMKRIENEIKIISDKGENLCLPGIDFEDIDGYISIYQ